MEYKLFKSLDPDYPDWIIANNEEEARKCWADLIGWETSDPEYHEMKFEQLDPSVATMCGDENYCGCPLDIDDENHDDCGVCSKSVPIKVVADKEMATGAVLPFVVATVVD